MKVCTDACLFGSLSPALPEKELRILDIGTGTGLLALMYAQQYPNATIDAVEIDEAAARQAAENFAASPWADRLKVYNTPIQQLNPSTGYDIIISNPPFFDNDLKSTNAKRNLALHSEALSLEELLASIDRLLNADGCFGLLLPFHRTAYFEELALVKHFYLSRKILVKQTHAHGYFRSILFFGRTKAEMVEKEITIKDADGQYSSDFKTLLKDYYLHL
jgi:tRNA1Val (adenine37-N6)-methyltransferase